MSCDFFFRGTLQMTRDLCIFLLFSLCRWHGSLRFLGMSDNSHVICRYYNQKCGWCSWIIHDVHWCSITMQCKLACSHCGSNLSWLPAVFSRPRIHPAKLSRAQGAKLGGLGLGAGPLCGSVMSVAVARFCKHVPHVPHVAHVPHGKSLPLALVLSFSCPVASQLSFNLSQEFRWSWMGQAGPILVGLLAQMTISWWFKCSYWLLDGYDWICTCRLQYQSSGMDHECHKSLNDAWLQLGHFSANEFLRNRRRNFLLYTCSTPKENEMGMALKLQFKEATGWVMIYEYNDLWCSIPFWRFLTDSLVPKPPEHRAITRFANCGCFRNGCGVQRHGIDGSAPLHQDRGGKVTFGDGPTASTDTSITRPYLSSDFVWYDILVKTGQDQDESIDLESHHVKDQLSPTFTSHLSLIGHLTTQATCCATCSSAAAGFGRPWIQCCDMLRTSRAGNDWCAWLGHLVGLGLGIGLVCS